MYSLNTRLFLRSIRRNKEIYAVKLIGQALALASSLLIALFAVDEFNYDKFHENFNDVFRLVQRNGVPEYSGNRLSNRIPQLALESIRRANEHATIFSRVKTMNDVNMVVNGHNSSGNHIHAADDKIKNVFSFKIIDGTISDFANHKRSAIISEQMALRQFGRRDVAGESFQVFTFSDTTDIIVAAVFEDYPSNSHDNFSCFLSYNEGVITNLNFDPFDFGVYGKHIRGETDTPSQSLQRTIWQDHSDRVNHFIYRFQPIEEIYFGPRVLGEESNHGDRYSIMILIFIVSLILFLAVSTSVNLSTLTLPLRAKELALKKLAGSNQWQLILSSAKESSATTVISAGIAVLILIAASGFIAQSLFLNPIKMIARQPAITVCILFSIFALLIAGPVLISLKFIKSTPIRLLGSKAITFPRLKSIIIFVQMGVSIFLIVISVVTRRQVNYSLVKEPGQNNDQIVYVPFPEGMTSRELIDLRTTWSNPHIVDVIATSQLPDRITSKDIISGSYVMSVDPGFLKFFDLHLVSGNWFKANSGDSIVIRNQMASEKLSTHANVIGVFKNMGGYFNQPDKPIQLNLNFHQYNYLCIRILEVDVRQTLTFLSQYFANGNGGVNVKILHKPFEQWLAYQDRLNNLSVILTIISGVISCFAVFGLSLSIVRDKLKEIAIHKMCGAGVINITVILAKKFVYQTVLVTLFVGPIIFLVATELLRTFIYATHLKMGDFMIPFIYVASVIILLCSVQAASLNQRQLSDALKN